MNTDITQLLEAAPQLAAILVLYIWHKSDGEAREREQALTIKTLSRIILTALKSQTKKEDTDLHG